MAFVGKLVYFVFLCVGVRAHVCIQGYSSKNNKLFHYDGNTLLISCLCTWVCASGQVVCTSFSPASVCDTKLKSGSIHCAQKDYRNASKDSSVLGWGDQLLYLKVAGSFQEEGFTFSSADNKVSPHREKYYVGTRMLHLFMF